MPKRKRASRYAVIETTCGDEATAVKIAAALLDKRLAACVQAMPITSRYIWKGEVATEPEVLLFIKAPRANFPAIEREIVAHHTYELPEVIQLPLTAASTKYLAWIDEVTVPRRAGSRSKIKPRRAQ
jgi:periplasmic divalent cation tolerance protein